MQKQLYSSVNEAFVSWLKKAREDKGLSLRDVGQLIGRHHSLIGNVENSVRRMDVAEFFVYCEALDIDPNECMEFLKKARSAHKNVK
ncbi:helix-turn-helix transcriptional regulator [Shewanella sp. 4t3-1-2LB]|uniref:helix-turn-helix domain-containing protein n=1 Tax=Shewanella sp. 4t3-1-2LB TaxID=2817682 RepID=UPI001A99F1E3|nr:helix-turn-helix transcriptional regulator [Shewanella sp. 4t3-1-2LB]